ncbi:MAG: type III secretion system stator protein SctL [Candidatus Xiphinematobacter sp.]|nr:MAG: type III secretion system stator protein SctL [Candidatus Xiphinematobacter sp.]
MNTYRFHKELPPVHQQGKILKASSYKTVSSAIELLEISKTEAQKRRQEAEVEWRRQQELGYQKGSEMARQEAMRHHWATIANTLDYLSALQEQMAETIIEAVRILIQTTPDAERVLQLAAAAVERLQQQSWIVLCVHPEDIDGVNILLEGWKKIFLPRQMRVETRSSEEVGRGDCVLESPIGRIDVSLEAQLKVIQEQMQEML